MSYPTLVHWDYTQVASKRVVDAKAQKFAGKVTKRGKTVEGTQVTPCLGSHESHGLDMSLLQNGCACKCLTGTDHRIYPWYPLSCLAGVPRELR